MDVQAFEELKRFLSVTPYSEFNIANWCSCACSHATRDPWFQSRVSQAATALPMRRRFFGIS
ncbi:MAG: hypothetical protein ABW003_20815, partial [Microvirga sp.]